jgi:hypothetical protein
VFLLLGVCNTAAAGRSLASQKSDSGETARHPPTHLDESEHGHTSREHGHTSTMAKPLEYAKLVPGFLARYRLFVKGGIMAHGRNDMPE